MKKSKTIIGIILMILSSPIAMLTFVIGTLLWLVFAVMRMVDLVTENTNCEASENMEEVIFVWYGLSLLILTWPFYL